MKITVATLHFGQLPYFDSSRRINEAYCVKHGYRFEVVGGCDETERAPVWGKISGVEKLLPASDFVLYLDADAYFYDHSRSIETLIEGHMGEASLLIGTDRADNGFAWNDRNGNSGVFVVRNSEAGRSLMRDWWTAPIRYDRRWLHRWPLEQAAFNYIVRCLLDDNVINLIPYWHLNGLDGVYIRHLLTTSTEERVAILRQEADRLTNSTDSCG